MSREAAGAALRTLRESRQWSLSDLAAASGVSVMGLSYLERGARKPHKSTVHKVEMGLGLPAGTYARLLAAEDPGIELPRLAASPRGGGGDASGVAAEVLEAHAEAHVDTLNSLIGRLPAETSNDYETYIRSVLTQCMKAQLLAAESWRVAADAGSASAERLMGHLRALEEIRTALIARLPAGTGARFEQACTRSGLPDSVIVGLLGISAAQVWDLRNGGPVPPEALSRVRAFVETHHPVD